MESAQNYCLSTSGTTARALCLANEMSSWNWLSQSLSFPVPQDKGNVGSGDEIDVNFDGFSNRATTTLYDVRWHDIDTETNESELNLLSFR